MARHHTYHSSAFDLAFFDQIVWNTAQGRWFETTFVPYNFLGQHMEPVLLLFAALYRLRPGVEWMLLTQAAVAAWAAVPLYLATRRVLASATAALLVAAAYLLAPTLHAAVLFDFHPEVMGTAGIFGAFALLVAGRPGWALAALGTVFLLKEDAALAGAGFALVVWLFGYRRHALGLLAAALVYAVIVVGVLMPHIRGGPGDLVERYSYLGADVHGVARTLVLRPWVIVDHLTRSAQRWALLRLLAGQAFLPLASPAALAAAPLLAANLLSTHPPQHDLDLQYPVLSFALLLVAAVLGIRTLAGAGLDQVPAGDLTCVADAPRPPSLKGRGSDRRAGLPLRLWWPHLLVLRVGRERDRRVVLPLPFREGGRGVRWLAARSERRRALLLASVLLLAEAIGWLLASPLGPRRFAPEQYVQTAHTAAVARVLRQVPDDAPVSAQSGLLPHLSQRRAVWEFPRLESAEYVVVDRKGWRSSQSEDAGYERVLTALPALGYCLVVEDDGVMLWRHSERCVSPL